MTMIDPRVLSRLEHSGDASVPVLIVCDTACASVASALGRAGITVTSTASMAVGSIGAAIKRSQLDALKRVPGVIAVELDEEATGFD